MSKQERITPDQTTPKRRWPRFSIRTLLIVMTLLCGYAACWWPTKTQGVVDVQDQRTKPMGYPLLRGMTAEAVAPLTVSKIEWRLDNPKTMRFRRRYYFWFFGYVAKLPYEREVSPSEYPDSGIDFKVEGSTGNTGSFGKF